MGKQRFTEYVAAGMANSRIDAEAGVVRGVKVVGQTSQNGRRYTADALQAAVGRYEGVRVNIDHDLEGTRKYRDRFGRLTNVRFESGGIYADLSYNPKHRLAEQFAWDATNSPDSLGLSHVVYGQTRKVDGVDVIENITSVQSVDVVADPATVSSLFESDNSDGDETMTLTLEAVKADKEIMEAIKTEVLAESKSGDELNSLREELEAAKAELKKAAEDKAERERREAIDKTIAEAKLPEAAVTDVFRKACYGAADDAALAETIEDRKAVTKAMPESATPKSKEQHAVTEGLAGEITDAKQFAEFITG